MLSLDNGKLLVNGTTLPLDSLRLVFAFFPTTFKWRLLESSEWQYSYVNLDTLSDEAAEELQTEIASLPPFIKSDIRYVLKDIAGQYAKISMKDLADQGIELLPALLESRSARKLRLTEWLASDPSVDFLSKNKRFGLTFSNQGVLSHYNKVFLPWQAFEQLSGDEKYGVGWKRPFVIAFSSRKGSGQRGVATEVANDDIEHFLAEYRFWLTTSLGSEGIEELQRYREERQKEVKARGQKIFLILVLLMVVASIIVCVVLGLTGVW